ncbi:hypothetical protein CQW23_13674 [Capsicum baccatum]|uniref:Protein TAR1 n=1 Tax=Capsicum baccatum TaxID=33114 RepID=A0A2G2WGZ2_CAPBA|nr:hypothetical protein CQW23_13674 [Capsicum baccatum]
MICMSVSLRASTIVSSGFAPLRHSSPSFGSRQVCSQSNPSQKIKVGRRCTPRGDPTNQLPCALRVYSPVDSHTCQTPWSVFQDGSNGEPTGQRPERADAEARRRRALPATIEETAFHERIESPGFGRPPNPRWSTPRVDRRTGSSPFHIRPGRIAGPHPLPSRQFQALFDSLFKVLFIFPSRQRLMVRQGPGTTGLSPSPTPPSRGLGPGPPLRTLLQTTIRTTEPTDSKARLFPVRSSGLKESLFNGLVATSRAANHLRRRNSNISPDHSIGRSDERCVQREGS